MKNQFFIKRNYALLTESQMQEQEAYLNQTLSISDIGDKIVFIATLCETWDKTHANILNLLRKHKINLIGLKIDGVELSQTLVVISEPVLALAQKTAKYRQARKKINITPTKEKNENEK